MNTKIATITAGILVIAGLMVVASYTGIVWAATSSGSANFAGVSQSTSSGQSVATAGFASSSLSSTTASGTDRINGAAAAASGISPVCPSGANSNQGTCSDTR